MLGERDTSLLLRRSSQRKFGQEVKRDSGSAHNWFPSRYRHYVHVWVGSWGKGITERALIGAPSVYCTSSLLHSGNSLGRWVIPFLLRSRHGDERALAERIKSCALRELAITMVSSYGNRPAVFKISERLRIY